VLFDFYDSAKRQNRVFGARYDHCQKAYLLFLFESKRRVLSFYNENMFILLY